MSFFSPEKRESGDSTTRERKTERVVETRLTKTESGNESTNINEIYYKMKSTW